MKKLDSGKRSSLFYSAVSDPEERFFLTLTSGQSRPYSPHKLPQNQSHHQQRRALPTNPAHGFHSARQPAAASTAQQHGTAAAAAAPPTSAVVGFQPPSANQLSKAREEVTQLKPLPAGLNIINISFVIITVANKLECLSKISIFSLFSSKFRAFSS